MENYNSSQNMFEIIQQNGLEGMDYLGCQPYERSEQRHDYANDFKSKTVNTRLEGFVMV